MELPLLHIRTIKQTNAGGLVNSVYTLAQPAVKYAIKTEMHGNNFLQVHLQTYFCDEVTIIISSNKLFQRSMIFCKPLRDDQRKLPSLVESLIHAIALADTDLFTVYRLSFCDITENTQFWPLPTN